MLHIKCGGLRLHKCVCTSLQQGTLRPCSYFASFPNLKSDFQTDQLDDSTRVLTAVLSVRTQSNRHSEFLSLIFNALEADLILLLGVFFLTIPASTVNSQNGAIHCHWPQMFHAISFPSWCAMEVLSCGFRKMHSGPRFPGSNPSSTTYWM